MYLYLAVTVIASLAAKSHREPSSHVLHDLTVDAVMPIFNEDPELLAAGIESFAIQTRKPRSLWLVDDGSTDPALDSPIVRTGVRHCRLAGIHVELVRQANAGKRHAQANAFKSSDADIFVTVDSDAVLRPDAIEKPLIPFHRDSVMSVGGVAIGQNHKQSLFTRVVELGFVMAFLNGRVAEGAFGAVRVNCGILAAYRGAPVRENLERYLNQLFLGVPVVTGDDRALTIYAKERGRAEFQVDAIAYTALPTSLSHLVRQRVRWARSWYWGTAWLLRRNLRSADFLLTFLQVIGMAMYLVSATLAVVGILVGEISPRLLLWTLALSAGIAMATSSRYVMYGRPDENWQSRFVTWLFSPLSSVLYMFILVPLYWYAGFTLKKNSWGTRRRVEVAFHTPVSIPSNVVPVPQTLSLPLRSLDAVTADKPVASNAKSVIDLTSLDRAHKTASGRVSSRS